MLYLIKAKYFGYQTMRYLLTLLGLLLVLKLNNYITWSWAIVLLPLYIPVGLILIPLAIFTSILLITAVITATDQQGGEQ